MADGLVQEARSRNPFRDCGFAKSRLRDSNPGPMLYEPSSNGQIGERNLNARQHLTSIGSRLQVLASRNQQDAKPGQYLRQIPLRMSGDKPGKTVVSSSIASATIEPVEKHSERPSPGLVNDAGRSPKSMRNPTVSRPPM